MGASAARRPSTSTDPHHYGCTTETVAITLNNDDKTTPFLAQSWVTDADGVKTDALMALPPLQRIDAGQKSQVRITQVRGLTDKLPQDRETLFWFNVRGVPPKPGDNNVLQLAMQSQLKLFYRPKAIIRNSSDQPESCGVTFTSKSFCRKCTGGTLWQK